MPRRTVAHRDLDYDRSVPDLSLALDHVVALVPIRGLEGAKARLGEALDAEERRALVERLLDGTVAAALATPGVVAVAVVSPDPEALARAERLGAHGIPQRGGGLNEGLAEGRAWAEEAGAEAVLVVPGDLPAVTGVELARVVGGARALAASQAPGDGTPALVALVTDRARTGTNVLLVVPPRAIPFRFGEGSRAAHADAARRAGATYLEIGGPLALDLDTPDDLLAAEAAGFGRFRAELP
jgi:2-phospho-L-lactate/phosphoenolpyruvate guanylyltransferase